MATFRASFANSRIKPRQATTTNFIDGAFAVAKALMGATPNGNTEIRPANQNRTFCTLVNQGPNPFRFATDDRATMSTTGFELVAGAAIDVEGLEVINGCGVGGATVIQINEGSG